MTMCLPVTKVPPLAGEEEPGRLHSRKEPAHLKPRRAPSPGPEFVPPVSSLARSGLCCTPMQGSLVTASESTQETRVSSW